jgi:CRISPR-associated protein Csb2
MPLVIEQHFLTGRFHATRWNQNPFEDQHGEWPPSPWRLLRTLTARWFEHAREMGDHSIEVRDSLLKKLAQNPPSFHLPANAIPSQSWPTRGVKQYQPTSLEKSDKTKGQPWVKRAQTTLVVDTFINIPPDEPVVWIWPDLDIAPDSPEGRLLDQLLYRITYFGRAESLSILRRTPRDAPIANSILSPDAHAASPVLVVTPGEPLDIEMLLSNTEDKRLKGRRIPPGTSWWYAGRPQKPSPKRKVVVTKRKPTSLMQFAVGGRVLPPQESWIRLTERFRGTVLKSLAQILTNDVDAKFSELPEETHIQYSLLSGKNGDEKALEGHQHVRFWLLPDQNGEPTRLVCHRKAPFDHIEQEALLIASERPIAWQHGNPDWQLRLVPLPNETPLPHDCLGTSTTWETISPYVPARHILGRNSKPRPGRSLTDQIQHELTQEGLLEASIEIVKDTRHWIKVHRPRREKGQPSNDIKLGYSVRLHFSTPVTGPIALGHSNHFGLGLFASTDTP